MELELIHYKQKKRRNAEFIKPPNVLQKKVGHGGLDNDILMKAQKLLEEHSDEFAPLADLYLDNLMGAIEEAKHAGPTDDAETLITGMLYSAVQLKANAGMFHYVLVSQIADRLVQFLEVIEAPDIESIEIVLAFHATMNAVIKGNIRNDGGQHGKSLLEALHTACLRYFENR